MKSAEACRQFAENRGDLLDQLARALCPNGGALRLLDADCRLVWSASSTRAAGDAAGTGRTPPVGPGRSGQAAGPARDDLSADPPQAGLVEIPLGPYGTLQIQAPRGGGAAADPGAALPAVGYRRAISELLVGGLESEDEFAHLVDDHIATTNQLLALYKIIHRTRDTWELPAKMEAIVDEAAAQCGAGQAVLMLTDDRWPLCIRRGPSGEAQDRARDLVQSLDQHGKARLEAAGNFVAAPIAGEGAAAGWLLVTDPPATGYKAKDLKLIQALSELAGGFLSTARLQEQVIANLRLEQEIEIASRIQALLLSRDLPDCPGLAITASCRPASRVGGDFYAAVRRPNGDLVFAFGDVAGKGVPAALFMAMTRTVLRTLGLLQADPMAILRDVNDALYQDLEKAGKFVTLVVGRYRPVEGIVDLANAGHSPVLVLPELRADPELVAPRLPPVGVLTELEGEPESWVLGEGGLLAIMSDGLSEARSPAGEFFGTERLGSLLRQGAAAGVLGLEESIYAAVDAHAAGLPRADDQTLLLLQRRTAK